MIMSMHLQRQFDRLKRMVLGLGTVVEETVEGAIRAVETRDVALAARVVEGDSRIDSLEIELEEECLHTLALYQPVAADLRFVVAVLKINNDLERIGDLAVNIAERVEPMVLLPRQTVDNFDLVGMGSKVRGMLKRALDALVNLDPALAQTVRETDDEVDQMHRAMYRLLANAVREHTDAVERILPMLTVSRNLERIADHAVNIAEDVIYMARGDITRHNRPHPITHKHAAR